VKFYLDTNAYGEPTIWHDPGVFPYVPVPVVSKLQVPPGYWDELVRRLTGEES
jgi:hypothetical protein